MEIQITKEEIEKSYEYRWRKYQLKLNGIVGAICSGVIFLILLITLLSILNLPVEKSQTSRAIVISCVIMVLCFLPFLGICLFYKSKMIYLKKNCAKMKAYVTRLDTVATSYWYPRNIYYEVTLKDENKNVIGKVPTNPLFSSAFFSIFSPEEVNNEYVVVLFDKEKEKAYVIRKAKSEEIL